MNQLLDPTQIKQKYKNVMGIELGELFHDLWNEVSSLHMFWAEFVALYASGEKRVEMLNRSTSGFFWIVDKVLWEHIMIQITRLLDASRHYQQERVNRTWYR